MPQLNRMRVTTVVVAGIGLASLAAGYNADTPSHKTILFTPFSHGLVEDTRTKPYDAPPPKDDLIAFVKQFVQP